MRILTQKTQEDMLVNITRIQYLVNNNIDDDIIRIALTNYLSDLTAQVDPEDGCEKVCNHLETYHRFDAIMQKNRTQVNDI